MNSRIQELAEQCTEKFTTWFDRRDNVTETYFNKEKFAQLIVRECMQQADNEASRLYNMNEDDCGAVMENYRELIKQHFGVES